MGFDRQGQFFDDLLNFIESFIHYSLFLKKVYPEEFFTIRTVFGYQIKVVKEGVLFDYIHNLVEDLKHMLSSVTLVRINYKQANVIQDFCDIAIEKVGGIQEKGENLPAQNLRDSIFKSVLHSMSQKLNTKFNFSSNYQENSFEMQIQTNGREISSAEQKAQIFSSWILNKHTFESNEDNSSLDKSIITISDESDIFTKNDQTTQHQNQIKSKLIDIAHFTDVSIILSQ